MLERGPGVVAHGIVGIWSLSELFHPGRQLGPRVQCVPMRIDSVTTGSTGPASTQASPPTGERCLSPGSPSGCCAGCNAGIPSPSAPSGCTDALTVCSR